MPSSFNSSVISQLGRIATQFLLDELASLRLYEIQSISAMGALNTWTSRQVKCWWKHCKWAGMADTVAIC